jgi:hypothetical protein
MLHKLHASMHLTCCHILENDIHLNKMIARGCHTIAQSDCRRASRLESEPFSWACCTKVGLGTQPMLYPRLLKQPDMESEQEALGTFKETFGWDSRDLTGQDIWISLIMSTLFSAQLGMITTFSARVVRPNLLQDLGTQLHRSLLSYILIGHHFFRVFFCVFGRTYYGVARWYWVSFRRILLRKFLICRNRPENDLQWVPGLGEPSWGPCEPWILALNDIVICTLLHAYHSTFQKLRIS